MVPGAENLKGSRPLIQSACRGFSFQRLPGGPMKTRSWKIVLAGSLLLLVTAGAQAKDSGPFTVNLKYSPQESVGASSVLLAPGLGDRPVVLTLTDGRPGSDPAVIGEY